VNGYTVATLWGFRGWSNRRKSLLREGGLEPPRLAAPDLNAA
jgi:hypothetical protein